MIHRLKAKIRILYSKISPPHSEQFFFGGGGSEIGRKIQRNLPLTEQQWVNFFSVVERFVCLQVLEDWILGTVEVFRYRQVSVMPRFRVKQGSP